MTYDEMATMIRRHEGYSTKVYLDTVGVPTGGYGHAFLPGSPIPPHIADQFLWLDIKQAMEDCDSFNLHLDDTRRGVIVNMLFNLGKPKFRQFRKLIAALKDGDYDKAALEMLDSKWASQVKTRAVELANIMKTGEI